jgi:hypothetical protein
MQAGSDLVPLPPHAQKTRQRSGDGARRIRTADLLGAIQALCQLSYSPEMSDLQRIPASDRVCPGAESSWDRRWWAACAARRLGDLNRTFPKTGEGQGAEQMNQRTEGHLTDLMDDRRSIALDDASVEAIAQRVSELLAAAPAGPDPVLMSAAELAPRLGRQRAWVYANAGRLGALRMGEGARPRLMFDLAEVEARLRDRSTERSPTAPQPAPDRRPRPRRTSLPEVELLPIGPARSRAGRDDGT